MDLEKKDLLLRFLDSSSEDEESSSTSDVESSEDSSSDEQVALSNFMEIVDTYNESDFKTHFRLKKSTIERLTVKYSCSDFFPLNLNHGGKLKIEARKEVYLFVWYISNTITFAQVANLFGIAKSSAWSIVGRVSSWLVSIGDEFIKWPQGDEIHQSLQKFEAIKRIPGVIGVIGSTYITIIAPKENKECYLNRMQHYSIILQAVVDANMKFISICCGEPGSLHDSKVLSRSELYQKAKSEYNKLFPMDSFLLGDSAYVGLSWIVPPFMDLDHLNDQHKSFNNIHSSTRMVVKNAFRLLKGRFRRIRKFTEQRNLDSIKKIVISACILHNLCIMNADNLEEFGRDECMSSDENSPEPKESNNPETNNSSNRRERLFNELCQKRII